MSGGDDSPADGRDTKANLVRSVLDNTPTDLVIPPATNQTINVNQVFVQVTQHEEDPDRWAEQMKTSLQVMKDYEKANIEITRERLNVLREAKEQDPDGIDKRSNNQTRRGLKWVIAAMAIMCLALGVAFCYFGQPDNVISLVLGIGAMLGVGLLVLASGESISADDVVRVIQAVRSQPGSDRGPVDRGRNQPQIPKRKGNRR